MNWLAVLLVVGIWVGFAALVALVYYSPILFVLLFVGVASVSFYVTLVEVLK